MSTKDYLTMVEIADKVKATVTTEGWGIIRQYLSIRREQCKEAFMQAVTNEDFLRIQAQALAIDMIIAEVEGILLGGKQAEELLRQAGLLNRNG